MKKADTFYPGLDKIFLKALDYPAFSRPEYFIREQTKSGWSKGIFLNALMEMYHHYVMVLQITSNAQKSRLKKMQLELPANFGLDLQKETSGEINGTLTAAMLEDLKYSILNAFRIGRAEPVFDAYQIVAMCERMFLYIIAEFRKQVQKTTHAKYLADTRRKEGQLIDGEPEYIIYHYNIISDAPVVDFIRFRNEVRKLNLHAINPEELKAMLKPLYSAGVEIVELWNNQLQPIEVAPNSEALKKVIHDQILITFDPEEWVIWTHNIYSPDDFYREPSRHFLNQDFAAFAAKVANFISGEILKKNASKDIQKTGQKEYEDFDDLFINPTHKSPCYDLLHNAELIGPKRNYTGNLKSAFAIWAKELIINNIIVYTSDQVLTKLLNRKFQGLNMSPTVFRTPSPKARKSFQHGFKKRMKQLSQVSQL